MRKLLVSLFLCLSFTLYCLSSGDVKIDNIVWQDGDIILTSSGGTQGDAGKTATNSEWTDNCCHLSANGARSCAASADDHPTEILEPIRGEL